MDKVKDELDITTNYANPGDHGPDIVRNNRTFKERYHAQYHIPSFHNIPKVMITYLSNEVVIELNYFPFKVVLLPYYILRPIVDQQTLEYKIHFTVTFE